MPRKSQSNIFSHMDGGMHSARAGTALWQYLILYGYNLLGNQPQGICGGLNDTRVQRLTNGKFTKKFHRLFFFSLSFFFHLIQLICHLWFYYYEKNWNDRLPHHSLRLNCTHLHRTSIYGSNGWRQYSVHCSLANHNNSIHITVIIMFFFIFWFHILVKSHKVSCAELNSATLPPCGHV